MVQISVSRVGKLQSSEADVVESLVVDAVGLVSVLDQLVDGEGGVVGLHHGVRDLGGGDHGVAVHDPVGELFPDLGDEEGSHSRPGPTSQRMSQLESLKTVTTLGLLSDNIENTVHQLGPLGVMTLGPIVPCSRLTKDEVVRTKEGSIRT